MTAPLPNNAKRVHRTDVGEFRGFERTPQGGMRIAAAFSRVGVFTYSDAAGNTWREYRPEGTVFSADSFASLRGAPVTDDHPDVLVDTSNWKALAKGHVGDDVRREGSYLVGSIIVNDAEEIARIESRERKDVSLGYECSLDRTPGVSPDGEPYDAIQVDLRNNHAALLPPGKGRAGVEVSLRMDGAAVQIPSTAAATAPTTPRQQSLPLSSGRVVRTDAQEFTMRTILKVGKREFKVDAGGLDAAQTLIDEQDAAMAALGANLDQIKKLLDEEKAKVAKLESMYAAAQAATQAATQQATTAAADAAAMPMAEDKIPPAVLDAAVAKRIALLDGARKILGTAAKFDGKGRADIQREVILKRLPAMKADGVAKLDGATLDAVYEQALALHAALPVRNDALGDVHRAAINVDENGQPRTDAADPEPVDVMEKNREAQAKAARERALK